MFSPRLSPPPAPPRALLPCQENVVALPSTLPVDEGIEVAGKRIELSMACLTLVVIENYPPLLKDS